MSANEQSNQTKTGGHCTPEVGEGGRSSFGGENNSLVDEGAAETHVEYNDEEGYPNKRGEGGLHRCKG